MVLKELILTVSTLGGCGDFNSFSLGECSGLEELISTVSTLGGCGGHERTDF